MWEPVVQYFIILLILVGGLGGTAAARESTLQKSNIDEIKSLNLQLQTYYDILTSILKAQDKIIQATARNIKR